jgi:hypothetical protein
MMYIAFISSLICNLIIDVSRFITDPYYFNCPVLNDPNSLEERDPHCLVKDDEINSVI